MGMVNLRLGEAAAVSTLFLPLLVGLVLAVTILLHKKAEGLREARAMRETLANRALTYGLLGLFVLMVAVPLFWMVTTALKPNKDLYEDFSYFPRRPTLEHFVRVIQRDELLTNIRNSLAVALDDDRGHRGRQRARRLQHRALPLPRAGVDRPRDPVQVPAAERDAVRPALRHRHLPRPRQHAQVAHADLPLVHRALLHLDADGVFPEHPAGAGGARDGGRVQQDRGDGPHPPAAVCPRPRGLGHLLVHPGLERVPPRARLHGRTRAR